MPDPGRGSDPGPDQGWRAHSGGSGGGDGGGGGSGGGGRGGGGAEACSSSVAVATGGVVSKCCLVITPHAVLGPGLVKAVIMAEQEVYLLGLVVGQGLG